ncbi:MAG: PAC2 family protein [Anaerolineae bacterium]|nr:PAC2 family protein [Anaerolineae bacterium]
MDELVKLWEFPVAEEIYMLVGWEQWADAGSISSGLPAHLIQMTEAHKIGELLPDGFYLFQIPGTHHLLRPQVALEEGYRKSMTTNKNEFYYTGDDKKGLVIFLGEEPHMNVDRYAEALLDAVQALGVKRVGAVGGVYGSMPYDRAREVSCVYSLQRMKDELVRYTVKFSNYEGGATIGTYLVDRAERRDIEFLVFYAFVPAYDFSQQANIVPGIRIETDYKAWYELLRRFNYMFGLDLNLEDLKQRGESLITSMDAEIDELDSKMPQFEIKAQIEELAKDFEERRFVPLGDVWERALRDIFENIEDNEDTPDIE